MLKHRLAVRIRAFRIWQKLGFMPWGRSRSKSKKGDFYKGAFDSIPFLNDDAKRTFVHLLLRPGYMIRDYIKGQHERYLAPLTSLIIFYAFFALVSSIINPDYRPMDRPAADQAQESARIVTDPAAPADSLKETETIRKAKSIAFHTDAIFDLLALDKHPEKVDSPAKASLAALESALRSQGVYLFLGHFLLLWAAMCLALRKKGLGISACAATAAYVLCQFCFFMFFSLFFGSAEKGEIGIGLMAVLLTVDYRQLFGTEWKNGFLLALKTGLFYALTFLVLVSLLIGIILLVISVR